MVMWVGFLGEGAKGFFVSGPYPLPQAPTPNPLRGFILAGEGGATGSAFSGPLKGWVGGVGGGQGTAFPALPPYTSSESIPQKIFLDMGG